MMLHVRDQNFVPSLQHGLSKAMRYQVNPLSCAAGKDYFIRIRRTYKSRRFGTGRLIGIRRLFTQIVDTTMDI